MGRDKSLIAFVKKKIERLCNINVTGHGLECGYQCQHGCNIIELNPGIIVTFFQLLSQLVRRQQKKLLAILYAFSELNSNPIMMYPLKANCRT